MTDILFSSWGGVVTDNRGKAETERQPVETSIAETPMPIQTFPTPTPTVPGFSTITSILAILYIYLILKK